MIDAKAVAEGLRNNELFLEYLPTITLADEHCVGAEALARWRHGKTILKPDDFIPAIEYTPVAGLITYWVIETVARELGTWMRTHDGIHISINVPPAILGRGGMEYAAIKAGMSDLRTKIILEITERGVPDVLGVETLNSVREQGIRVALDDVGTGGANIAVLCRANVDMIKTDRSFVNEMCENGGQQRHLGGLPAIVRATHLDVVVEGVESEMQARLLKEAGVKMAQGFYFSPPLSARDFTTYYSTHH